MFVDQSEYPKVTSIRCLVGDKVPAPNILALLRLTAVSSIVLVQENLNTHCPASIYKAFSAEKTRRLVSKIEWHYLPMDGSWRLRM
tara:strand:- start:2482 stop:2739 length:258 start_codon:yes stop_codon:yes gene_type:complete